MKPLPKNTNKLYTQIYKRVLYICMINTLSSLSTSAYASLYIQFGTGLLDLYALFTKVPESMSILKELLLLELIVQVVEFIFYIWLIFSIKTETNITPKRYFDWVITTPTMLVTLVVYLIYLQDNKSAGKKLILVDVLKENKATIIIIILLNWAMLLFGYLGEIKYISNIYTSVMLGFIPFIIYFTMIYEIYVKKTDDECILFFYFFIVWGLYGVAACFPYIVKNTMYNILDLFSKNYVGLFLSYLILSSKISA